MPAKLKLTKTAVEKLTPQTGKQYTVWDSDLTGYGVRVSPGGTRTFFYQGRLPDGRERKITIGKLGKITAEQARKSAIKIAGDLVKGTDPVVKKFHRKEGPSTLGDLMEGYILLLESQGKLNARSVKNSVYKHIKCHSRLWNKPADEITLDDCVKIVGKVKDEGKLRQADLIRSYLKTAYSAAINSAGDVNAPKSLRELKLTSNPAGVLRKVKGASRTRDRVLTESELQHYWRRVKSQPEPVRSILMLHLLLGGQRQQQLVRTSLDHVDWDSELITVEDYKGRREVARLHTVPLLPEAQECIRQLTPRGPWIFSCNGGESPVHVTYMHLAVKRISEEMLEEGEVSKPFTAGSLRATVETRLAARRVSSDVLAHLLSHGLGGVQQKHYQRHDYHSEKLEALERLERILNDIPEPKGNVHHLRAAG